MSASDPFWKAIIQLGFYAGLRKGEMLSLTWGDIDFERHQLRITPKEDWAPKDRESREIELHPTLEEYLGTWKKLAQGGSKKVVRWDRRSNQLSMEFTKLLKRSGVAKGSLHSLRHSFAYVLSSVMWWVCCFVAVVVRPLERIRKDAVDGTVTLLVAVAF